MSIATQKTLEKLRMENWTPWVVERWLPSGTRRDLYHIIDVIGISPEKGIIGIQSTTTARTEHLHTLLITEAEHSRKWLQSGGKLELWCWRKLKKKKKDGGFSKLFHYVPMIDVVTVELVEEALQRHEQDGENFNFSWLKPDK